MNKHCYCARQLQYDDDVPKSQCRNCCRDLSPDNDEAIYTCFEDETNCVYHEIRRGNYFVCRDCYEEEKEETKNEWDQADKTQFILKKFVLSISAAS